VAPPSTFRDDVPDEIDDIVLRCLEKDPAGRPQTVGELVELLLPFATENVHAAAERVRRIVHRTTRPPVSSNSVRAPSVSPTWGRLPLPSTAPRRSSRPAANVPLPLSRTSRSVPPPRASARPASWPPVDHTRMSETPRRGRFGWGIVGLGACIGAIAAVAAASLNRSAATPVPALNQTPQVAQSALVVAAKAPENTLSAKVTVPSEAPRLPRTSPKGAPDIARAPKHAGATDEKERDASDTTPDTPKAEAKAATTSKASVLFGGMD
jgi:serine/threonine-protein kinase